MKRLLVRAGVPPLLSLLSLVLAWELLARSLHLDGLPTAAAALREVPGILSDRESLLNIADSLRRMFLGSLLALLLSVPAGLAMGRSRAVNAFLSPLLAATYPIPKAALMPIIMLWFGIGDTSKVLVIFLGVSLPLLYHSCQGARSVDEKLLWSAMAMGMGRSRRMLRIVLPSALPEILLGCRVGLAMALIVMVSSEMIARQSGAGNLLFNALDMALYPPVYALIVILGGLGFLLDFGFERVRRLLTSWADHTGEALPSGGPE